MESLNFTGLPFPMYLHPLISILLVITSCIIGILTILIYCNVSKVGRLNYNIKGEKLWSIPAELIVFSSILYLYVGGSNVIYIVAGHMLLSFILPFQVALACTRRNSNKPVCSDCYDKTWPDVLNNLAHILLGFGVIYGWVDGAPPWGLAIAFFMLAFCAASAREVPCMRGLFKSIFKY